MKTAIKGIIVTAAFIGPGTVTTASVVGAELGYQIVWALVFSIFATCILQLMAHRLGAYGKIGLSEATLLLITNKPAKFLVSFLIICAIGIGNAAYEGGNITGAALGIQSTFGGSLSLWSILIGSIAAILLISGKYQILEKVLVLLVAGMSFMFISLMFVIGINWSSLAFGLIPRFQDVTLLSLVLALIGTTIVPYNLFLHSGMTAADKSSEQDKEWPLFLSLGLGGLVTLAIISSAATAFFAQGIMLDKQNLAQQLEPVLGERASIFFALGLFSAGITSAITAPLAASYAISGLFGWTQSLKHKGFMSVALLIVIFGTLVSSLGFKPFSVILLAQTTNAILLPISAILLLIACNSTKIMKSKTNSRGVNLAAISVILVVFLLSLMKLIG
ncbi:NRAMP family divalent metal transporter [Glaciecola sp. 1036]|uniref:NRAMP family divalent metal transporter n=1 Tax=Alteromonadaceae TaxID=72275 RepID=UPI003D02CA91